MSALDFPSEPDEGRVPAPPLTQAEREVVERFENAPDPFTDECRQVPFSDPHLPDVPLPYCAICTAGGAA